jgi:hypothetical protein
MLFSRGKFYLCLSKFIFKTREPVEIKTANNQGRLHEL